MDKNLEEFTKREIKAHEVWLQENRPKIALVTGCNGQTGSYLCELLLSKNY